MNSKWSEFVSGDKTKAAGIVICFDDEERILILRRSSIDKRAGQWTIPGGHIDEDDASVEAGAVRELKEETNLQCTVEDLIYIGEPKPEKFYFLAKYSFFFFLTVSLLFLFLVTNSFYIFFLI